MSRYTIWEQFMADVVATADSTVDLKELFELTSFKVVKIIIKIILPGWLIFNAVVLLLNLAFPGFLVALGSFSLTPGGIVLVAIFGASMVATMRLLYQNRQLPIAIKKVGDINRNKYHLIRQNYANDASALVQEIDTLFFKCVKEVISLARDQAEALQAKALVVTFEKIYLGYTGSDAGDVLECFTDVGKAVIEVEIGNLKEAAGDKMRQLLLERIRAIQQE